MSNEFDLLSAVQPSDGWFCILGIKKGKGVQQSFAQTRAEADELVQKLVHNETDAYFAVAKFETDENRQKSNVKSLKSFWLDIDCGETKGAINPDTGRPDGYVDQVTAMTALKAFCKHIGLPKPVIVNSGRGIHVYWPLTEEVSREQWEPVAYKLRELCLLHNLYVDPAVFEVARVLRVPGTFNFKDDPPKPVYVLAEASPVDYGTLAQILNVDLTPQTEKAPKREMTALGQQFIDATVTKFDTIIARSRAGNGCQQIMDSYDNRGTLSEPRWFNVLSVAKFCADADGAIQTVSEGHPDYDPHATAHKIRHILGPHTCDEFEKSNPGGCEGCPYQNKIKSPIVIGREVEQATEEDNLVVHVDSTGVTERYHIPEYPPPFFRGKNGGIWFTPAEEEKQPELIYEHDLYVLKRMKDPLEGDVVIMKLHTPHDGILEFVVPNTKLIDPSEIKKILARHGVLCATKAKFERLVTFVTGSVRELQSKQKAEMMRLQFGWADNDSKFIVGDREITALGTFHSPAAPSTETFVELMQKEGTLEKWKEVFDLYGKQGLEPHAFAALSAFGSPLLKFAGQTGALINVIHPNSGTGKTTILHMQNSVWGHPAKLAGMWDDTNNAKFVRLGIMNNLPVSLDEITNMDARDLSHLAYGISQGKAKERMKGAVNELRKNLATWCTIVTASSNSSLYETLGAIKNTPDGEMMRVLEYKIGYSDAIDQSTAKYMFDHQLKENYGHAGDIYAEYLVKNLESVKHELLGLQKKIDHEFKTTQKERFWSATIAANIMGGLIAKHLGLLNWDMKRIYYWCGGLLQDLREEVKAPADNSVAVLGDYINRKIQNILVVNDEADSRRSNMPLLPLMEPRGDLLIRYEPDTKRMYFAAKPFKADCVSHQINYKHTMKDLEQRGIFIEAVTKRLSKGMKVASPGVHSLVFDCSNAGFLDIDAMLEVEETIDEGGEG